MMNILRDLFPPRLDDRIRRVLIACLEKLPAKTYGIYRDQMTQGLVRFVGKSDVDHPAFENYVNFSYNPDISVKFQDWNGRFWRVTGIKVTNREGNQVASLSIFFSHGLVSGYSFSDMAMVDPDANSIDVANATCEFLDSPDPIVSELISPDESQLINWSDVFEVYIDGKQYFHLWDIGDGDFIGIDADGLVYEVRHDPLEVIGLEGTLSEILVHYPRP